MIPFTNPSIPLDQLPKAAELPLQPVDARYLKVLLIQRCIVWLATLAAVIGWLVYNAHQISNVVVFSLLGAWMLFVAISWIFTSISFKYRAYAVREKDIVYRKGWLVQSIRVCPFNRIQHCSVDSGVVERKYGLSSISIFTAGGAGADMKIGGIPADVAADLREFILSKTNSSARG